MEYVNLQFGSFLLLLLTGMALGGFFDLYRVFRSTIKVNKIIDVLGDLLFWIFSLLLIAPLIFWSTWLELRFYVWFALATGLVVYFLIFSSKMVLIYRKFWKTIIWLPQQVAFVIQRVKSFFHKTACILKSRLPEGPGGRKLSSRNGSIINR